ncbi:NUDIX hydrolase [Leptospira sp. GIMC2001]|uniref:NUDIX hydrolase n=1 Tax=Leptospira sp. GIMC2001 TaxID=1513297 RepID=UPI002349DE73|nr:NUDIX hydrolase [Leptospira sp. GIMC2001]WCL51335.1 NUDIX hydrolase [Leptospira sp. GIMC2001]
MNSYGNPHENLWERKNRKILHTTPIFDLVSFDATAKLKGHTKTYYALESKSWVNVIAISKSGKIVLVRQYRHGIHEYCLELPGGIVDESGDDAPLISAKRELAEETGYTSNNWEQIGKVSGNPAVFNNWCYTFLARDAEKTLELDWDESEEIDIFEEDIASIPGLIRDGVIHHSMMVAAFGFYFYANKS